MKRLMIAVMLGMVASGCGNKHSVDTIIQESADRVQPPPPDLDNGLSSWNIPSSEFGQWCYKVIRIVKAPSGKYIPEMDINIRLNGVSTNTVSQWEPIFEGDGFSTVEMCQYKIRRAFEIKKGICDAFQGLCPTNDTPKAVDTTPRIVDPAKTNMPPGYLLQKNQEGEYRVIDKQFKIPLVVPLWDKKTRENAIARAWRQYDYSHRDTTTGWEDVR